MALGFELLEIGAVGTEGMLTGVGAIAGGATGLPPFGTAGMDRAPEVLGTSFSLGISLGGAAGVVGVGATTGAPGVAQGLMASQPQLGFLQPCDLILSSRLGR